MAALTSGCMGWGESFLTIWISVGNNDARFLQYHNELDVHTIELAPGYVGLVSEFSAGVPANYLEILDADCTSIFGEIEVPELGYVELDLSVTPPTVRRPAAEPAFGPSLPRTHACEPLVPGQTP